MGRNPRAPGTLRREEEQAIAEDTEKEALDEWKERMENLEKVREAAAQKATKEGGRQAKYYDERHREENFAVGQKVWIKNEIQSKKDAGVAAKLAPLFTGPFTITAKLGDVVYELQDDNGESIGKVHVRNLKAYHEEEALVAKPSSEETITHEDEETGKEESEPPPGEKREGREKASSVGRKRGRPPRKTRTVVRRIITTVHKRPRASIRNVKIVSAEDDGSASTSPAETEKRGRGRPKGSTKKSTPLTVSLSPRRTRNSARKANA